MADPKSKYVDSGAIARFKEKIVELIVALFDTKMDVDGSNSAEASEIKFGSFDDGTKSTISMKNGVITIDADQVIELGSEYEIPNADKAIVDKLYVDNTVKDIGLNFFVAEYGKSTFDEVCSAAEEGKAIFMLYAGTLIPCSYEWFGSRPGDGLNLVALVPGYSQKVYSFTVNTEDDWFNSWDNYTTAYELNNRLLEKQDVLVSGTNIKTVNGTSLLGKGNVNTARVYGAIRNATSADDIIQAIVEGKIISLDNMTQPTVYFRAGERDVILFYPFVPMYEEVDGIEDIVLSFWYVKGNQWTNYTCSLPDMANYYTKEEVYTKAEVDDSIQAEDISIKAYVDEKIDERRAVDDALQAQIDVKVDDGTLASDDSYGLVKTNSAQAITTNEDGQLEVGGRLGQFPDTTGIYAAADRDPRNVGDDSFLITDALGMDLNTNRAFALVSGYGITCKSAAAGSTQYRVSNTYANRLKCKMCEGGYASIDEATSKVKRIVPVVSVTIDGQPYTPSSSADDSSKDIVITVEETLNPDRATTGIRLFGVMKSYSTAHIGNGVASHGGGRNLLIGGGIAKYGSSNDNCIVGNDIYVSGNGNAAFGRLHIMAKNRAFAAGSGHDFTNAKGEGVAAFGTYSRIDSNTLLAVGEGSNQTERTNAFEVRKDGIVLKSPNGTRYRISVDDSGVVSASGLA